MKNFVFLCSIFFTTNLWADDCEKQLIDLKTVDELDKQARDIIVSSCKKSAKTLNDVYNVFQDIQLVERTKGLILIPGERDGQKGNYAINAHELKWKSNNSETYSVAISDKQAIDVLRGDLIKKVDIVKMKIRSMDEALDRFNHDLKKHHDDIADGQYVSTYTRKNLQDELEEGREGYYEVSKAKSDLKKLFKTDCFESMFDKNFGKLELP